MFILIHIHMSKSHSISYADAVKRVNDLRSKVPNVLRGEEDLVLVPTLTDAARKRVQKKLRELESARDKIRVLNKKIISDGNISQWGGLTGPGKATSDFLESIFTIEEIKEMIRVIINYPDDRRALLAWLNKKHMDKHILWVESLCGSCWEHDTPRIHNLVYPERIVKWFRNDEYNREHGIRSPSASQSGGGDFVQVYRSLLTNNNVKCAAKERFWKDIKELKESYPDIDNNIILLREVLRL